MSTETDNCDYHLYIVLIIIATLWWVTQTEVFGGLVEELMVELRWVGINKGEKHKKPYSRSTVDIRTEGLQEERVKRNVI